MGSICQAILGTFAMFAILLVPTPTPTLAQTAPTTAPPTARGASGDFHAALTAAPVTLTVGDPITLTLEVAHPATARIVVPQLDPTWGDFEIRSQSRAVTTGGADGMATTRQTIVATLFAPGSFNTPPLEVLVVEGDGQSSKVAVAPAQVTVDTVLKTGDQMPRDIRPQAVVPAPPLWPAALAALALFGLLVLLAALITRRLAQRGGEAAAVAEPVDTRSATQIAHDELDRIDTLDLLPNWRYKTHYTLTTDCLRAYLAATYDIPALDQTSSETLRALARSRVPATITDPLRRFFAAADLVKFARQTPSSEAAAALTGEARALVDLIHTATQPVPTAPIPTAPPTSIGPSDAPPPPETLP
jgi:hypothetical protein